MRVKLQWLKDFLDLKNTLDVETVVKVLNLSGLEVEAVESLDQKAKQVMLAPITELENQGNSLSCKLVFKGKNIDISLPSETSIELEDYLAFLPNENNHSAVYCPWSFFGFENQKNPIFFKAADITEANVLSLLDIPEFNDQIIELSVTPNRPDALSHLGISREIAALLDLDLKSPMLTVKEMGGPTHEKVTIEIIDGIDCPRYSCRVIENIKIGESPWWLKLRLLSCGIKPINNVVDVTNYVMLSRGQPMHAFDYQKLSKEGGNRVKIFIRKAKNGEQLVTLDAQTIELSEEDLVICDASGPLALAGVIGGQNSKVDNDTTSVLLESAYFLPQTVRKSSKRHDISTESSFRFERGMDPNAVVDALNYAARLLVESSNAISCRDFIDVNRARFEPLEVKMRPEKAIKVLGYSEKDFDQDLLRKRFIKLGIETVAKRGDAIYFRIPTFRPDITREIDLIEESVRMIGFDKITGSNASYENESLPFTDKNALQVSAKWRQYLISRGFNEVINYSFLPKNEAEKFLPQGKTSADIITVKNPLSERYEVMRPSLLSGLLKNLGHNVRNQEKSIRFFELGAVFFAQNNGNKKAEPELLINSMDIDSFAEENQNLAGLIFGEDILSGFDSSVKEQDFYHLKGVLLEGLKSFGFSDFILNQNLFFSNDEINPYFHPHNSLSIYCSSENQEKILIGQMGELHPDLLKELDTKKKAYAFELDLKKLSSLSNLKKIFKPFSRFPFIERDLALLVDESVAIGDIISLCSKLEHKELVTNVKVFDIYRGKNLAAQKKSVALSFTMQSLDQTLRDEDAQKIIDDFIKRAEKELEAVIRT